VQKISPRIGCCGVGGRKKILVVTEGDEQPSKKARIGLRVYLKGGSCYYEGGFSVHATERLVSR
jgi:hypothetical protein